MSYEVVEKFIVNNMSGDYEYSLCKADDAWKVECWEVKGSLEDESGWEHQWTVEGKVVEDDGVRQKREPFTEETAREELERWRR